MVVREGFEPSKAEPSDLQSDPFGRSGTSPEIIFMVPLVGFEPTTCWLQVSCSTKWAKAAQILNCWREWRGSNPRPLAWQASALTSWATPPQGVLNYINQIFLKWWSLLGSNQWPPACKAGALPTELSDRKVLSLVRPRGIEPLLPGWKPEVLTTRRRAHSLRCLLSSFFISSQDE